MVRSVMNAHYESLSDYERVSEVVDNLSAFLPCAGRPHPVDDQPSGDTRDFMDEILSDFEAGQAPDSDSLPALANLI